MWIPRWRLRQHLQHPNDLSLRFHHNNIIVDFLHSHYFGSSRFVGRLYNDTPSRLLHHSFHEDVVRIKDQIEIRHIVIIVCDHSNVRCWRKIHFRYSYHTVADRLLQIHADRFIEIMAPRQGSAGEQKCYEKKAYIFICHFVKNHWCVAACGYPTVAICHNQKIIVKSQLRYSFFESRGIFYLHRISIKMSIH